MPNKNFTDLLTAIKNSDIHTIDALLTHDANLLNMKNEHGNTPILIAAICGNLDTMKCLFNYGASLQETNPDGLTAFLIAAKEGHTQLVEYLFQNLQNVMKKSAILNQKTNRGNTALSLATKERARNNSYKSTLAKSSRDY